jgi:hypothetical protein
MEIRGVGGEFCSARILEFHQSDNILSNWTGLFLAIADHFSDKAVCTKPLARRTLRVSRIGCCSVDRHWLILAPWMARPL